MRDSSIPLEWLGTRTSVAEIEARFTSTYPNDQWLREWASMIQEMRPEDELRRFRSPPDSWLYLAGRAEIALVRDGTVVNAIITVLN